MTNKQATKPVIIIMDGDKLNTHIVGISKAASKLNDEIQLGLASAVYQATHGRNTNHLNALLIAVGRGIRKTAIAQWALQHAPVVMNDNKESMKEHPFKFSADKLAELAEKQGTDMPGKFTSEEAGAYAMLVHAQHWTDHKEPPLVPETWSLTDAVKKLIAQATTYEGKGTKITGGDLKARLQELLPTSDAVQGL